MCIRDRVEDMAKSVSDTMANLKTNFKLKEVNNKHEQVENGLNHLTAAEKHAHELRQIANGTKTQIK
jgi:hypothetical protein